MKHAILRLAAPRYRSILDRIIIGLLVAIMALIVIHAPLSVFIGSKVPAFALGIKAWKEIMMAIAALLVVLRYGQRLVRDFRRDPLIILCGLYVVLHIVLALPSANGGLAAIAGLMVDLRYIVYFVLVYVVTRYNPQYRARLWHTAAIGAVVVLEFLLAQFVLPADFLKYLGYNETTIAPYMLVDMNPAFVRYNSTLRGPNPLGAYAIIVVSVAVAWWLVRMKKLRDRWWLVLPAFYSVVGLVAVWVSYSRSALVAAAGSIGLVAVLQLGCRVSRRVWLAGIGIMIACAAGLYLIRGTEFFHTVIIHDNPATGAHTTSNDDHAKSLSAGIARMAQQPLGAGVGTTGSAAMYGSMPHIIENQYVMVAHEVGWLGLVLFVLIYTLVLRGLWKQRRQWYAVGLWASGVGLVLVGIVLPVWADDTVSIVWWGLAAAVCSKNYKGEIYGTSHKKTT